MAKATRTIRHVLNHERTHGEWLRANHVLFNRVASFYVRRLGIYRIALQEQKVKSNNLLGHPTYLEGKPKEESSMLGKQLNAKVCSVKRCKSCVQEIEVKPTLVQS